MNDAINSMEILKKLKELLDIGALTQEEFDRKKAEFMNSVSFTQTQQKALE
ncbi:MAG: SHOCT domain-containing protein, partial [Synergistaceae bacterium]|nr:SHOCT domain-containing protein [Synergistaceae bacterium]